MTERCPVCRGSGRIRLPLYRDVVPSFEYRHDIPALIEESSREYPCPECKADSAPFERVQTIAESYDVVTDAMPKINEAVRYSLARKLAEWLLEHGMITFEIGEPSYVYYRRGMTPIRGTLSVVAPKHVMTMQERIEKRQFEVAESLVQEAEGGINNFGSYYGHVSLSKDQACRQVREALGAVKAKLAIWKVWHHE
jgi:predicted amidophosphoribosyltransferase